MAMWIPSTTQQQLDHAATETVLAPVRVAKDLIQVAFILVGVILTGLLLPVYCFFTGTQMTAGMWEFSGLTAMGLFSLYVAPYYTICWGFLSVIGFGIGLCNPRFEAFVASDRAPSITTTTGGFFLTAIVWGAIRSLIERAQRDPSPSHRIITGGISGNTASADNAPETSPSEESESGVEHAGYFEAHPSPCAECTDSRRVLDVPPDADEETIKAAYRDLAMVWHPDRFGDNDSRLRTKAEGQFQSINTAYEHLKTCPLAGVDEASESAVETVPITEALKEACAYMRQSAEQMKEIVENTEGGVYRTWEEKTDANRRFLLLRATIYRRMTKALARAKVELPSFPTAELEEMLETLSRQKIPRL